MRTSVSVVDYRYPWLPSQYLTNRIAPTSGVISAQNVGKDKEPYLERWRTWVKTQITAAGRV